MTTDFNDLQQQQGLEEVRRQLANAEEVSSKMETSRLVRFSIDNFLKLEIPERDHILYPIIPTQGLVMLYASRGMGKTFFALSMAWASACGGSVFRWNAPKPRKVLYIDGEMPAKTMQERLAKITAEFDGDILSPDYFNIITPDLQNEPMPNLATPEGQAKIDPELEGVELLVIDNLATLARNGRENESESWIPVQKWLLELRRRGISVLLIHHANKGGNQRGTSAREDILDTVIALKTPSDYTPDQGARFAVHYEKARGITGEEAKPFAAELIEQGLGLSWRTKDLQDVEIEQVRELLKSKLSVRDIAEETGLSKSKVGRIKAKINKGEI